MEKLKCEICGKDIIENRGTSMIFILFDKDNVIHDINLSCARACDIIINSNNKYDLTVSSFHIRDFKSIKAKVKRENPNSSFINKEIMDKYYNILYKLEDVEKKESEVYESDGELIDRIRLCVSIIENYGDGYVCEEYKDFSYLESIPSSKLKSISDELETEAKEVEKAYD